MSGPQTANAHAQVQGSNNLPPIPPYEPVTLTWDPSALYPEEGPSDSSNGPIAPGDSERGPTTSQVFSHHSLEGAVPADAPPSYVRFQVLNTAQDPQLISTSESRNNEIQRSPHPQLSRHLHFLESRSNNRRDDPRPAARFP
jgi:hypothetical protein